MSKRRTVLGALSFVLPLALAAPLAAQETTTYTYDAQGRLKTVQRSGGPSNGVNTTYVYDKANNRTNVTITGSANGTGSSGGGATVTTTPSFVVTPLGGYALIFYN